MPYAVAGSLRKTDTSFKEERFRCGGSVKLYVRYAFGIDRDENQPGISGCQSIRRQRPYLVGRISKARSGNREWVVEKGKEVMPKS